MSEVRGIVQSITPKKTTTGKTMYTIKMDGVYYSGFEKPECNAGDEIALEYTVNGNFKNYTGIEVHKKAEPKAQAPAENPAVAFKEVPIDDTIEQTIAVADKLSAGLVELSDENHMTLRMKTFEELMKDRRTGIIQKYKEGNINKFRE